MAAPTDGSTKVFIGREAELELLRATLDLVRTGQPRVVLTGCMVVVRPDQYVAHVLPLHGHEALADFVAGILIDAGR